jgi:hypothetical protein
VAQHRNEDTEPAINDTPERPTVPVPSRAEFLVVRGTRRIVLDADAPPVIRRPPQTPIAGTPHRDEAPLAARSCDGSGPQVRAKSVIIALRERRCRFSEHRDGDFSSDSRQGFENGDVAMLAAFVRVTWAVSKLLQELFELSTTRQPLRVYDLQTRQDQPNLRLRSFDDTRRVRKAGALQALDDIGAAPSTNAVGTEQMIDSGPC